ncbi:DUF2283 domain-containing protein [Patescibacteria group bacterium]
MKIKNTNRAKISYEPEADVLMWEISNKSIDYAKEIDNVVVHFTANNVPVLIEILEASKFLDKAKHLIGKKEILLHKHALETV